eukprot:9692893-Alexandrium_andersonii.AAC.1
MVVLHLFSGHRREGDFEDWLTRLGSAAGLLVKVVNGDLGHGPMWDLRVEENVRAIELLAEAGAYDQVHAGPPCSTWSRARYAPDGPPP